ncbi:Uric acid-xanthine permease [Wickerhamiella sorbophila]|uniref:Uric acid-xanthine permease n=1 Tax=Wickerhamiella sorbophila TaxID=45607 RepID=A0A2T0FL38_9ASCO|nr:Uric acid-xanthine permease [Wickerhamiella sorbophila]PRT55706.1 Uric acid-xanthine permease [Wickerhamiella sorbophila]
MNDMETNSSDSLPAPATSLTKTWKEKAHDKYRATVKQFTTRDGLIGGMDYSYLFTPSVPFIHKTSNPPRFFALNEKVPILLACLLGLQHALAMMGGLVASALLFSTMANLNVHDTQYLVSASLISAGILSFVQIKSFKIPYTSYRIGSGTLSVLGTAFSTISVFGTTLPIMYKTGFCPVAEDGTHLPCPEAYGAFLGTSALCALFLLLLSFTPKKYILKIFPRIVNGPVVLLVGCSLIQSGMEDWAGGSGCVTAAMCPSASAPKPHPWGSGQFIGLGFSVFVTIVICEKWGPPMFKSCSIVIGLLIGCVIAAGCGYFSHEQIDASPSGQFLWVRTFKLQLYGPIVLPLLAVYVVITMETIGDITATCDVSRLAVEGPEFDSRIQGGLFATALACIAANLMTLMPQTSFTQNNGVIAMTQCAARVTGYFACMWLILMGVIGKFSAAIVAIPKAVIGGMTTFLFTSVALSGLSLIAGCKFTRRDRLVLTISLMWGFGSLLVPNWFSRVFTYKGDNTGLRGFLNAINIVMETPYAIGGISGVIANLVFPQSEDDLEYTERTQVLGQIEEFEGSEQPSDGDTVAHKSDI